MSRAKRNLICTSILTLTCTASVAHAGRGGFHGGGGGGFRGGGGGGFRGGSMGGFGGYHGGASMGGGGMRAGGFEGNRGGAAGGYRGGEAGSFNRTPSFGMSHSYGGYEGMRAGGANPYSGGRAAGAGSYTGPRGTDVRYGGAAAGVRGPGGEAGRAVGGVNVTGAGGRSFTEAGRVGGVAGAGGAAVGRSGFTAASGYRGTAATGYRGFAATGAGGYGWHNGAYGAYHNGWVHGYWNGHYGGWGGGYPGYGYGGYGYGLGGLGLGLGLGLGMWGLGSMLYGGYGGWGYMPYSNPYYGGYGGGYGGAQVVAAQPAVYDYSQPINTVSAPPAEAVADPAVSTFDKAREAFKAGDYANALALADQAIKAMPNDTDIHQFRAQTLFALQRYPEAAAALYSVLSVGPGWDWTTLIGLYPDVETYTNQLRALESYCKTNPNAAPAHFVLAYQYLTEGFNTQAADELKIVTSLMPADRVSAQLLKSLQPPAANVAENGANPAPPPVADNSQQGNIAGTWSANSDKDTAISLTVNNDNTFVWKVTSKGQSHQLTGKATYENGSLSLANSAEGSPPLVGQVVWQDPTHFKFQALGGGPSDPGLSFAKTS